MKTEPHVVPCPKHPESEIYSATKRCVACAADDAATAPWPVMTRNEAIDKGYRKYWTGKICVNGHIKQKYSASGICIGCNSMNSTKYSKKIRKRLIEVNLGLESVTVTVHPEDAQAIRDYAATLSAVRGLT